MMVRNVGICMKNCIIGSYLEKRGGNADQCWLKKPVKNNPIIKHADSWKEKQTWNLP